MGGPRSQKGGAGARGTGRGTGRGRRMEEVAKRGWHSAPPQTLQQHRGGDKEGTTNQGRRGTHNTLAHTHTHTNKHYACP